MDLSLSKIAEPTHTIFGRQYERKHSIVLYTLISIFQTKLHTGATENEYFIYIS